MDNIDIKIIEQLKIDARISNKDLGALLHLTGQAIGIRIANLEQRGVIKKFTIETKDIAKQFIRFFLDRPTYKAFEKHVNTLVNVDKFYKTSGGACYCIVARFTPDELVSFLESTAKYGRYTVETILESKLARQ